MTEPALERLQVLPQYAVPQHLLSRAIGLLAESRWPLVKNAFIRFFLRRYGIDMSLALEENPDNYASFNEFFTRPLKPEVRPITDQGIACPADGTMSQLGAIAEDRIFQAKGHDYSLTQLLGGDSDRAAPFRNGQFATVYLAPRDYHRVHMPCAGTLREMVYVPGRLFSVNQLTAGHVPGLFARNERVVAFFDTELGPMAVVLVGAMVVASIETVWAGIVAPPRRRLQYVDYRPRQQAVALDRGEEMGRFRLGSTVIVLFGPDRVRWQPALRPGSRLCMGEQLATLAT
ncbi:MAG: phosphatidylserine decarboxylase [Pseudomonadales bacterium]|nr:phosphatidylserine decarboxylase [Pseudomonadales bacterium]